MAPTQNTDRSNLIQRLSSLPWADANVSKRSTLLAGDAIATMDALPAGCADLVFADPPYFLSRGGTTVSGGKRVAVDKGAWDRARGGIDAEHAWTRRWFRSAQRLLRPSGTIWVCGNYQSIWSIGWAAQNLGARILNNITWCKPNASPNLGCRQMTHSTEMLLWAAPRALEPSPHVFNYAAARALAGAVARETDADAADKQLRDYWQLSAAVPAEEKKHGKHPTQKPVELIKRAMAVSLPAGGVVVDPFMGSGTAGVAALWAGAGYYIGVDLETLWRDVASRRLADIDQ